MFDAEKVTELIAALKTEGDRQFAMEGSTGPFRLLWRAAEALAALSSLRDAAEDAGTEWEYAVFNVQGEHIWPLDAHDEEVWVPTLAEVVTALDDNGPDYWEPTDRIMRRQKSGTPFPVPEGNQ